jgi:RHS repeat-associated protein
LLSDFFRRKWIASDRFGHTVYRQTGNGARHEYTYEPKRQRLQEMKLFAGDSLLMHNIYTFDAVDNIRSIVNDTQSRHAYSYDDLNRLVSAAGKAKDASYTLGMEYDIMGNPTGKKQMTQGSQAGSHEWAYVYNGPKPNAAMQIGSRRYAYDGNGNPTSWEDSAGYRLMAWDEENRLTALDDNAYISRYVYDHSGERVVKTHGGSSGISINGVPQGTLSHNENTTLYVSPYFTVGKNGAEFTKHYYAGSQRLVSKLGNGRFNNHFRPGVYGLTAGGVNYIERMQSISQSREEYIRNLGIAPGPPHMKGIYADPNYSGISYPDGGTPDNTYVPAGWPRRVIPLQDKDPSGPPGAPIQYYPPMSNETAEPGFAYEGAGQIEESGRYFYHGDHLGSTSYVTDARGRVSQYVAYMPYGEALFEEHSNTRDMPYLFNSKERDEETGLYYYGARYLDPETAVWYGVDPLAMKYPDYSPYVYCANNPINCIDPDGKDAIYITFPKYKADGYPFTGHAGVLLIDNKTGLTKYYEYGRFNNVEKGLVRNYPVADVVMKDGMPTAESLNKVLTQISNKSGKG